MSESAASWYREDAQARHDAVDVRRNVILRAPAGSGKTTVLVCRLLELLAVVDVPESILAITFTRKAAAEMRQRVFKALRNAAVGAEADAPEAGAAARALARSHQLGWDLLRSPARLRVQTIDATHQRLVALCPVAAGGNGATRVTAQPDWLYQNAARRCLQVALSRSALHADGQLWLQRLDNNWTRLTALIAAMLSRRSFWLPLIVRHSETALLERVQKSLRRFVIQSLNDVERTIPAPLLREAVAIADSAARTMIDTGVARADLAAGWLTAEAGLAAVPEQLPRWRFLSWLLLVTDGNWRKQYDKNQGVSSADKAFKQRCLRWLADMRAIEGALPVWQQVEQLAGVELAAADRAALSALSRLLVQAAAELNLEFAGRRMIDFVQLAATARQALTSGGEPTDLALRSGEALRHILVDEFQDTSTEQVELLRLLTAAWSAGDGRTLFAVGDPLQSVYLFRDADVALFLQAQQFGIGALQLESLQLRRNFRSAPTIVDWVNTRIGRLFPARDDPRLGAIRFLPALATCDDQGAMVQVHAGDGQYDAATEAAAVLRLVQAAWAADPKYTIAVLVSKRNEAAVLIKTLQSSGIKVLGIKLNPLGDRAVVRDLLALTRALQHADDRTAWLALLRGPYCGLELSELQLLAEVNDVPAALMLPEAVLPAALSESARARLVRVANAMRAALCGTERNLGLSQRVHSCWLRLGGAARCRDERELADARAFFAALDEHANPAQLVGEACSELTSQLYATPDSGTPGVAVLTMHAAKGLEWDVVIVPALGRLWRVAENELLNVIELPQPQGAADLLMAPILSADASEPLPLTVLIRKLQQQRAQLERQRLLYVTATRAKRQLHWLGHAARNKAGELKPAKRSMLSLLWPAVSADFEQQLAATSLPAIAAASAQASTGVLRHRLRADWSAVAESLAVQRLPLPVPSAVNAVEYSWVGQTARAIGTVVHAELHRCTQRQSGTPAADLWLTAPRYAQWLAALGVVSQARESAAQQVLQTLQATLLDPRGRWLLTNAEHRFAWSERALTGVHAGRIVSIVIDRMLVDGAGTRWVVDYKTSPHEGGVRETFIAQQLQRYRPQLQLYAALAARLGPEPVRTAIYFPVLGEWREL